MAGLEHPLKAPQKIRHETDNFFIRIPRGIGREQRFHEALIGFSGLL
jgi:hypothetical protein